MLAGRAAAGLLAAAGLPAAPEVALRRSALSVSDDGLIAGEVLEVRTTPGQLRLVVRTELGELDAVASLDRGWRRETAYAWRSTRTRMAALTGDRPDAASLD